MIKVTKKNEVSLKVEADASTLMELSSFFTFDVPGAKFMPSYKSRQWDGKARLFHLYKQTLPVGLLSYLHEFAVRHGYEVDDQVPNIGDDVTVEYVEELAKSLNLHAGGDPIEAYHYQIDAVFEAINDGRRLLLSPTASGKSLILYLLIRHHLKHRRKQLLIVPTTSLVEQMYTDFEDYSSHNSFDVEKYCHRIYGGKEKTNQFPVTISTWQSIYKYPMSWFDQFDVIYGDEAHQFKAKSLTTILDNCINSPYRVGTTGTLDGTKTHKLVLEGCFGPVKKVITTKELMDADQVSKMKIIVSMLDYSDQDRKTVKGMTYQEEMDWLISNPTRNTVLKNLTLAQTGNTLLLFQYVDKHGKVLFKMLEKALAGTGRKVFFVSGDTDTTKREQIRAITEKETDCIIVASYGTFSTGINIKELHNLILGSPIGKAQIRLLQSIGRILRKTRAGLVCNVFDVADDLQWKKNKNYTLEHVIERIKTYNEQQFDYKLVRVPLNE